MKTQADKKSEIVSQEIRPIVKICDDGTIHIISKYEYEVIEASRRDDSEPWATTLKRVVQCQYTKKDYQKYVKSIEQANKKGTAPFEMEPLSFEEWKKYQPEMDELCVIINEVVE